MTICIKIIFVKLVPVIKVHTFNFVFSLALAAQLSHTGWRAPWDGGYLPHQRWLSRLCGSVLHLLLFRRERQTLGNLDRDYFFFSHRRRPQNKMKKSPVGSWRSFFNLGKSSSVSKRKLQRNESEPSEMKAMALKGESSLLPSLCRLRSSLCPVVMTLLVAMSRLLPWTHVLHVVTDSNGLCPCWVVTWELPSFTNSLSSNTYHI